MSNRPIVMYLGGFANVGGIETFARDFLLAIAPAFPERELVIWAAPGEGNLLLQEINDSGVQVTRSPWRWGCVWNLPDFVLVTQGLGTIRRAAAVIFQRPPPSAVLQLLRRAGHQAGQRIPFILIMPYRPAEYWGRPVDLSGIDRFDAIAVQSEEGINDLRKLGYRGRVENIPLLPPPSAPPFEFPSRKNTGTIRLGFLGRMVPQKNLGYLLDVYRALTRDPDRPMRYELHLFGGGPMRAELEAKCEDLQLPKVIFHGEIPRADVARAIDSCDLFVITSLTEGQCLVALEVLSRGRPLVAAPVGSLPDILAQPEFGRLAPLDAPEKFAASLREVIGAIQSGQVTPQSIAHAFEKRYNRSVILGRYLQLLHELGAVPRESLL